MFNRRSRTQNVKRNISYGMIERAVAILTAFIVNTVLIKRLGIEYGGLTNSLKSVSNILLFGNFGFEAAVVSSMYKAFSEEDSGTIVAYTSFLKQVYRIIGCILIAACFIAIPFLNQSIHTALPVNISVCFLMFISDGIIKYFISGYLWAVPTADQRGNMLSAFGALMSVIKCVLQCIAILSTGNYYMFAFAVPMIAVCQNILIYKRVMSEYPYLKTVKGTLTSDQKKDLFWKIKGLFFANLANKTRNEMDTTCISIFIGLAAAGVYGNYIQVFAGLNAVLHIINNALIPSVGNSIATETVEKNHADMKRLDKTYIAISGLATVCLLCLYQPFMYMWMGGNLTLQNKDVFMLVIYFYLLKLGDMRYVYYQAAGLWHYGRYFAIAETITNIILNVILCKYFGVFGIIAATTISVFFLNYIACPIILYKRYFKNGKLLSFYTDHIKYSMPVLASAIISWFICQRIPYYAFSVQGVIIWIIKGLICTVIYILICGLCVAIKKAATPAGNA